MGGSRRIKVSAESITSANFGRVTSVSQARAVQVTLQVDF